MPSVQSAYPIALLVADIHLSLRPPIWRSAEKEWLKAMERPLSQLQDIVNSYNVPILCAGDIFDHWYGAYQSSELINFALEYLPHMYAVPGQHDLSNHNLSEIKRSAFWTLVEAKKIEILQPKGITLKGGETLFQVYGFPFGVPVTPLTRSKKENKLQIAVTHLYVWTQEYKYPNAPLENKLSNVQKELLGYDVVIFGDNHKHFISNVNNTIIYNCGGFMRRKSDENNYIPKIGVLMSDHSIQTISVDVSEDRCLKTNTTPIKENEINIDAFIEELENLGIVGLDFSSAIKQYTEINKTKKQVRTILYDAMEQQKR